MRILFFLLPGVLFCASINAQYRIVTNPTYNTLVNRAVSYYCQKDYLKSGLCFDSAFNAIKGVATASDWYNGACSWALAGNKESAFSCLLK